MASEQMGMPAAAPSAEEMAVFDQMRQNISPKEFSDEMLAGASQVDPQAVSEFRQELDGLDMPPEVLDALNDLVDEILANPERYDEIRQQYIEQGIPDDFLPEQFDPQFFAALNMAIDQMIGAPAGPQAFAKGGIAELKPIAKAIAGYGRNGDTMLAHITPAEARMLKRRGGSGTINPKTGLPEFFLGKLFKSVGNALKKVGNAVKKFANSTVGRLVTTVALGFFLGPAAASALGVSSAAGVAAVSGFVGSAGSTLLGGGSLRDALKAGAVGGIAAGAGAGLMGGSEAFTSGSYTGPTTVSGQFERATSAFSPTPLQQAAAAPIPPAGGTAAPLGVQTTGAAPGTAPVPEVPGAFMEPGSGPMGEMSTATGQAAPAASQVAPPIDVTAAESPLAKFPGAAGPEGVTERFKGYFDKINPSKIQEAGALQADLAGQQAMEAHQARMAAMGKTATAESLEAAYQTARKAAMPGVLGTYGPMTAVGIGALGAAGGFESKPAPLTPEAQMMRDRLQREEQMMKDNPGMFTPSGMERFGAVYNDKGQIVKWNPWTPESAGAFAQYRSPLRFPMFAPPPPLPEPVGAEIGGAGGRGYAKGGLASLAGGGMPGYAEGGDVTETIKADLARLSASGDPGELDRWLATTAKNYSLDQLAAASGYKQEDIQKAMNRASQDYTRYFLDEMVTKQGTTIDPTSDVGRQRIADVRMGFDTLKENPVKLQEAMYKTGVGVGDLANATGLDAGTLAAWLRSPLVNSGMNFDQFYEFYNRQYPGSQTVAGPGPSRRLDVGYYKPVEYSGFDPESVLYFDEQGKRSVDAIRRWWDESQGKASQKELDKFLVDSGFSAEMMNQALPQFSVGDLQNAISGAAKRLGRSPQTLAPSWGSYATSSPYAVSGGAPSRTDGIGGLQPGGPAPAPSAGPVGPAPGVIPPAPAPQTPTAPPPIPWNTMPDFQRYVEATAGSPIRPTFSVLGNQVSGTRDPFGAGKQTPIYSRMGAPTSPMAQSSSILTNSSINLPQYMFDPIVSPAQATFNPAAWYGPVSAAVDPKAAVHTDNPSPNSPVLRAQGGIAALASGGYPRRTGQIDGPGTETSDSIPAMLSDGEFVMTAKAVRGAGNGSRREGAKKMYALMHRLEKNAARG